MADDSAATSSSKATQTTQQRFEFYFVALTFTLLGLAVQTGLGGNLSATLVEVGGWLLLLVSGLAGLNRLEWIPEIYRLHGLQFEQEERAQALKRAELQGTRTVHILQDHAERPIGEVIENAEHSARVVDERISELNQTGFRKHRVQRWTFIGGLGLVLVARAVHLIMASI